MAKHKEARRIKILSRDDIIPNALLLLQNHLSKEQVGDIIRITSGKRPRLNGNKFYFFEFVAKQAILNITTNYIEKLNYGKLY